MKLLLRKTDALCVPCLLGFVILIAALLLLTGCGTVGGAVTFDATGIGVEMKTSVGPGLLGDMALGWFK